MRTQWFCSLLLLAMVAAESKAVNPVSWAIDVSTTGQDVFWTSPTAITTGLADYDWSYNISKVTATLQLLGDQNITGFLGDATSGSGTVPALPLVLLDEAVDDSTTGSAAHVRIEVDANGFGQAAVTDITLGSLFGFNITRLRVEATVDLVGYPYGDYDRDRDVDLADYNLWQQTVGSTANLDADGNRNTVVDVADYVVWRDHLGQTSGSGSGNAAVIPEPSSMAVFAVLGGALFIGRRWMELKPDRELRRQR